MIKAAWASQCSRASYWRELADINTIPETEGVPGAEESPQTLELKSLNQECAVLKAMGCNAIAVVVADDDGWQAGFAGGASYDPRNRPTPWIADALDMFCDVASQYGLGVIVSVDMSAYRMFVDDTYGSPKSAPGAWDFIHSVIDPAAYYPGATSFIGDPRIIGWVLGTEIRVGPNDGNYGVRYRHQIQQWWPFFDSLVHWPNGKTKTAWTGLYTIGGIDDPQAHANAMATQQFCQQIGMSPAAVLGLEGYMNDSYPLKNAYRDMMNLVAGGPASRTMIMEAGCNQAPSGARNLAIFDMIRAVRDSGAMGVCMWQASAFTNDPGGTAPSQAQYALCDQVFKPAGKVQYKLTEVSPGKPFTAGHYQPKGGDPTDPKTWAPASLFAAEVGGLTLTPNAAGDAVGFAYRNL